EPVRVELDEFVAKRLLATGTDENGNALNGVAHEAFLSAWPPLAEAIRADVSALRARRAEGQAADEWEGSKRPRRRLWEGNQLAGAVDATGAHFQRVGSSERPRERGLPGLPLLRSQVLVTDRIGLSPQARNFLRSSIRWDRWRRGRGITILSTL